MPWQRRPSDIRDAANYSFVNSNREIGSCGKVNLFVLERVSRLEIITCWERR